MKIEGLTCADCGFPAPPIEEKTLRNGSSVREPGEALCHSCSAKRSKLVRDLALVPATIELIRAYNGPRSVRSIGRTTTA